MRKKFLIFWSAGIVSSIIALPYIFALQHEALEKAPISLTQIGLISVAQVAVLLGIAVFFGLKLSQSINLFPLLTFESGTPLKENLKRIVKLSVPLGIAVALIIKLIDIFFIKKIPELGEAVAQIPFWKALLVAPYGGVVEELLMRLFLVSLFAWLIGKILKATDVINNNKIMWSAIAIVAIIFGLGHLPATATITQLTPIVVTRAILLNGIGGIVFGWLYWKRGLEYAIVAHFTTDIVLHAILPLI